MAWLADRLAHRLRGRRLPVAGQGRGEAVVVWQACEAGGALLRLRGCAAAGTRCGCSSGRFAEEGLFTGRLSQCWNGEP